MWHFMTKTLKMVIISSLVATSFLTACDTNDGNHQVEPDVSYHITQVVADETEITDKLTLEQRIESFMDMRRDNIRGLGLVVFTKDDIILEIEYGYADTTAGLAVDADTVFPWASVTKLLVYVSAMQLYEQGKLDFHADIFTYIPQEYFPNIIYPITMFDLMHHQAGFSDHLGSFFYMSLSTARAGEADVPTLEDSLKSVSIPEIVAQDSQPGERVLYSNYGIALAGYVIQQIAGIPFYEYVRTTIFTPLDMNQTA